MSQGNGSIPAMNPDGGIGGGGITMPPYYKPTASMGSASTYDPTHLHHGRARQRQAVLLRLRPGLPAQHPRDAGAVADGQRHFLTHLHVDHYGELPYLFAFAPWAARWKPLRVHVTKDAIWTRTAALSEGANPARPSPSEAKGLFDLGPTHLSVDFPDPRHNVSDVQEPFVREKEIDPNLYYPQDVKRDLVRVFPRGFKIEIPKMVAEKLGERVKSRLGRN